MGFDFTIAILTATFWEFRAIQRACSSFQGTLHRTRSVSATRVTGTSGSCRVILMQTGIGPIKAAQACRDLCASESVDVLIASGFIGGLQPANAGSLVIAHSVESIRPWPNALPMVKGLCCDPGFTQYAVDLMGTLKLPGLQGKVVTAGQVLTSSTEKHRLAEETRAVGIDMESAAIGWIAHEHRCPFVVVRSITDGVSDDLPIDFNLFLSPGGWVRGISALMSPRRLRELYHLKHAMDLASQTLTRFFQALFASPAWEPISQSEKVVGHG